MNTPTDPTTHFVAIKTEHAGDKIVRCGCGFEQRGFYHEGRAVMAGERHVKETA